MAETPPMADFQPIVTRKATDLIAEQIRRRIFAQEFRTGEMLPSEAELVRQTASSSASVRGALRALEAQGLVQMRAGRSGGAIVRIPGETELAATVTQLIRGQAIGLDELLEMQQAIEPVCAELAARHRTAQDLDDLHAALEQIRTSGSDSRQTMEVHSHWHTTVARASGNELLSGLMVALLQWIFVVVNETHLEVGQVASSAYEEINEAIASSDPARAKATMRAHVTNRAKELGGRRSAGASATPAE